MKRRDFIKGAGAVLLSGLLGANRSISARNTPYSDRPDIVRLPIDKSPVRILQFTDIHFFIRYAGDFAQSAAENAVTAETLQRLTSLADPHLILVTGDFWHDNPDEKGVDFLAYGAEVMAGLKRPWIFTWGNHDQVSDLPKAHQLLKNASGSLYAGDRSGGNYVVRIGPESQPWLELFCLNSGKEGLKQPAREWMGDVVRQLPVYQPEHTGRVAVFHIPLRQYSAAWEHPQARGFKGEGVSYYQEDGKNLSCFVQHSIRVAICGHNHTNDYEGSTENTRLIYGRATGLQGYGGDVLPKGAKLYEYDPETRDLAWKTVLPDGTIWQPSPGEKSEKNS